MTSCDYCELRATCECAECGRRCCDHHSAPAVPEWEVMLCSPPQSDVEQQRGCYKPPVAEVARRASCDCGKRDDLQRCDTCRMPTCRRHIVAYPQGVQFPTYECKWCYEPPFPEVAHDA